MTSYTDFSFYFLSPTLQTAIVSPRIIIATCILNSVYICSCFAHYPYYTQSLTELYSFFEPPKILTDFKLEDLLGMTQSIIVVQNKLMTFIQKDESKLNKKLIEIIKNEKYWSELLELLKLLKLFINIKSYVNSYKIQYSDIVFIIIFSVNYFKANQFSKERYKFLYILFHELLSMEFAFPILSYFLDNRYKGLFFNKNIFEVLNFAFVSQTNKQGASYMNTSEILNDLYNFIQQPIVNQDPLLYWTNFEGKTLSEKILKQVSNLTFVSSPNISVNLDLVFSLYDLVNIPQIQNNCYSKTFESNEYEFFFKRKYQFSTDITSNI